MDTSRWSRALWATALVATTLVGVGATPVAAAPTTAVATTISTTSPDVPQGGINGFVAGFTVSALDPADGPIVVELTQDDPDDTLQMSTFSANLTGCTSTATSLQCTWTPSEVGEIAVLGASVSDFTLDAPGTVVTVTAGATVGGAPLGQQTASFTVTDPQAVVITPSITVDPDMITPPETSAVTITVTVDRLDADWGEIVVWARTNGVLSSYSESPPNFSCLPVPVHGGLVWLTRCTWFQPQVGDRATIRMTLGDSTNPYLPAPDELWIDAFAQVGSGPQVSASATIAIVRRTTPLPLPQPVEPAPAFTG